MRLRDCQIVNLQMNTMVAGTMLRGMFEDRSESHQKNREDMWSFLLKS